MNKTRILIVEDESLVALDIKVSLEDLGYHITDICKDKEQVLLSIQNEMPKFVLMDINLNLKNSGIDIARVLYEEYSLQSIFITAYCDEDTIKKAVICNPLAYLSKPFKVEELHASIIIASHKQALMKEESFCLGKNYSYDISSKKISFNKEPIKLSKKESDLLYLLVIAKGNIVYYDDIEASLWKSESTNNNSLRALIYRFRTKLKDLDIETIPSFGLKLDY